MAFAQTGLRELPPLLQVISDEVGVLSLQEGRALSRTLDDIEKKTRAKIIVLIAETTQPESVEAYVQRLVNRWRRDRPEGLNNGRFVFVVIAKNDRVVRVVPGEKLASILKPFEQSSATREALAQLKQGKYYEGLGIIVNKLSQLIPSGNFVFQEQRPLRVTPTS
jgi:uncharacterized protein